MSSTPQNVAASARDIETAANCERLMNTLRASVPIENFAISGLNADGLDLGSGTLLANSFPAEWLHAYFTEGYQQIDPIVSLALTTKRAVTDEEAWLASKPNKATRNLQALLEKHDIGHRTLVPVMSDGRVFGAVTIASKRPLSDRERGLLQLVAEPLHRACAAPMDGEVRAHLGLTAGEMQCLDLASHGLTSDEISERSSYSTETVNTYLKSATKKLKAKNRTHAVAEALRRKLLA